MRLRRNDKGEFEEINEIHVTPELLILSKLEHIEEELQLIHKADYETRLKADMVAMLTEIREKAWYRHSKYEDEKDFEVDKAVEDIVNHIDAKINALKGEDDVDKT